MAASPPPPTVRIVSGELETRNVTTRLVIPTSLQPTWPPFLRAGETVASRAREFPVHFHEHHEVLTYVSEGFASYQWEDRPAVILGPGSARLLSTGARVTHRMSPARKGPVRWFSLVVGAPDLSSEEPVVQVSDPPLTPLAEENAFVRLLVGAGAPMSSRAGLECQEITFLEASTSFRPVGHRRRGLVYALTGRATVDGKPLDAGEAALVDGASGFSVQGTQGTRVVVATAPRKTPA